MSLYEEPSQEEIDGLNQVFAEYKSSIPLSLAFDNIIIDQFITDMKTDPRHLFTEPLEYGRNKIIEALASDDKVSVEKTTQDHWQIKTRFLTWTVTLHCYTKYDQSEMAFEDHAIHSVAISVVSKFNTKYMHSCEKIKQEEFDRMLAFYTKLL